MSEHQPTPSPMNGMEKSDVDRITDDYFSGKITQEEYGSRISILFEQRVERFIDTSYPTNGVGREDVLWIRPDLAELGDSLTEAQIKGIAFEVGDALQEMYWEALKTILDERYPIAEDEEEADPET